MQGEGVLRRSGGSNGESQADLECDDLRVNLGTPRGSRQRRRVACLQGVPPARLLMRNRNKVATYRELLLSVWGPLLFTTRTH